MKAAVDKVKKGKGRTVNARFTVMCAHSPVRSRLLQRRQWLEERRGNEERPGQQEAHLDRRANPQMGQL